MGAKAKREGVRIRIWDLPLRLVHWSLVLLVPALWWTWRAGNLELHEQLGFITLGLLLFRILWGFFGSSTARFSNFVKGPRAIAAYLRGTEASVGHNPMGALSVLALLGIMLAEVGLGLFSQDVDGQYDGPLAQYVSYEAADWVGRWHWLLFNAIIALVALHVLAILFYALVRRDDLVGPMLTGRKRAKAGTAGAEMAPRWRLIVAVLIAAAFTWWVSKGFRG